MDLVILAALFVATLFVLFKVFELRAIPLLPAIVVNYATAFVCGLVISRPWAAGDLSLLWTPSLLLSFLFISVFYLTGFSAQRAGVAPTTVASKMSLVLTVLFSVLVFKERQGPLGWAGIVLALVGVVLSSWGGDGRARGSAWLLPVLLFFGNAAIDIGINVTQRTRTTPLTEAVFPTVVFGFAGVLGLVWVYVRREQKAFSDPRTWIGGVVLGAVNYGSLYFVVKALANSGLPSSSVFPLMNIGVILFGSVASMALFKERPRPVHLAGIAASVLALLLIMSAQA
ncbi:MAG: DMT family transporter [Flavobacteriales bacterium]|nr:DMT family transporter [Flavobacteriales bacterium]